MPAIFGNGSETTSWGPAPTQRGTFGLVSSCLVTLSLCVLTALHLNIPAYGKSYKQKWYKLGWLVIGFFAPEFVVFTAYRQYRKASSILTAVTKGSQPVIPAWRRALRAVRSLLRYEKKDTTDIERPSTSPTDASRFQAWNLTHGHYISMGGLAVEIRLNSGQAERLTLNPECFQYLVDHKPDALPAVSEEDVKDKSKTNWLAKTLVCLQATWFSAQCLTRMTQRVAISLLELNTFGHCLCALLVYLLWWNKPLDIEQPTLIHHEEAVELVAFLNCNRTTVNYSKDLHKRSTSIPFNDVAAEHPSSQDCFDEDDLEENYIWYVDCKLYDFYFKRSDNPKLYQRIRPAEGILNIARPYTTITPTEARRWKLAARALRRPDTRIDWTETTYGFPLRSDWHDMGTHIDDWEYQICLILAGFIYGGLHLAAWKAPFRTLVERTLWRYSSITVTSSGPVVIFIYYLVKLFMDHSPHGFFTRLFVRFYEYLFSLLMISYAVARVYLFAECFIQLGHLPTSVFAVPTWSSYFPHIS